MDQNKEVVYFDESCITSKLCKRVEYAVKSHNVEVDMKKLERPCTAFIVAISLTKGLFMIKTFKKSVNTNKFLEFLKELK